VHYWLRLARETAEDWKARGISKPRNVLPASGEGSLTLRVIRRQACKDTGVRDCLVWSAGELAHDPGSNPCTQCKTMGIGLQNLSEGLWGIKTSGQHAGELEVDEADIRGWLNGRYPAPPKRLRTAVVKAWARGWLNSSQAASALSSIVDHEAAGAVSRLAFKRWRRSGKAQYVDHDAFASAIEIERRKAINEQSAEVCHGRLPSELRKFLDELPSDASRLSILTTIQAELLQICSTEGAKSC
jgi:hypothetical protein